VTQETRPAPAAEPAAAEGSGPGYWHFLHLFYRLDRGVLARMGENERTEGRVQVARALTTTEGRGPAQMHAFAMVGHKADFGVVMAAPDVDALHRVQMDLEASTVGPALERAYSFYSITEVSEYVPDVEQYADILRTRERMDPESPAFQTRVKQYAGRLGAMNRHRLFPTFPEYPVVCFYPMNKMRVEPDQNWYRAPFSDRMDMMTEHGKSGMKFAGRVSQVITASTGLDDWEWGVTLWAQSAADLKEIVYTMRFDRASAQYAEFGPFYPGTVMAPSALVAAIRL
jgi:chlorite dismutase